MVKFYVMKIKDGVITIEDVRSGKPRLRKH